MGLDLGFKSIVDWWISCNNINYNNKVDIMKEYIIVGDTKDYNSCLIYRCGDNRENAERVLNRLLNNSNDNDKFVSKGHFNIRIEEVDSSECWWNDTRD
jgi:hypothetical protein